MITEVGFNNVTDVSGLHIEDRIVERRDHGATAEVAEIATLGCATRVVRVSAGEGREVFTFVNLLQQRCCKCPPNFFLIFIGILVDLDQDV